jgi:predicted regulator of Ras-like GTPase activity (Roadblock/LC7/MglB family)
MNHPLLAILSTLRDIEGVLGSFIWLTDGTLLASDVPESCPPATLQAVGGRVQRLCDAFVNASDRFEGTTLAFSQYKLHVCTVDDAFIGVVLSSQVNMSALKMAVALARRELSTALADPYSYRAPSTRVPLSTNKTSDVHDHDGVRSYRGQRLPD